MKKCNSCGLRSLQGGKCPVFNSDMRDKEGCPAYTAVVPICELCGSPIIGKSIIELDKLGNPHEICGQCFSQCQCLTCAHSDCAFENDKSCNIPTYIVIQKRQGPAIMQTQVPNLKRIEATCRNCPCYRPEGNTEDFSTCWRRMGMHCGNHKSKWENNNEN